MLITRRRFGSVDVNILKDLRIMLQSCNSYVRSFVTIDEQLQSRLLPQSVSLELLADRQPSTEHRGRYNVPSSNEEVAILMTGEPSARRSIVMQPRVPDGSDAGLQVISETHRSWDPLHYVLMFPYGTDGFHLDIQNNKSSQKCVSAMEYYCYRLMQRDNFDIIHRCGRLFQQYIVDACAKIQQLRLNYTRFNQNNLRSDIYSGVADAVLANDYRRHSPAGRDTCIGCFRTLWASCAAMASHIFLSPSRATYSGRKFSHRSLKGKLPMTDLISSVVYFDLS